HSRYVRFCAAKRVQRSAVLPHGFDQLPQCADLSKPCVAKTGDSHFSLRVETCWFPAGRQYGRLGGIGLGDFRPGGPEDQDLSEKSGALAGDLWTVSRFA